MTKIFCDICNEEINTRNDHWLKVQIEELGTQYYVKEDPFYTKLPQMMHIHRKCWLLNQQENETKDIV